MKLRGIDLELVEQSHEPNTPAGVDVVFPNAMRINGVEVLGPQGSKVVLSTSLGDDLVTANLTVFVRSLAVHAEELPAEDDTDPPLYEQLLAELGPPLFFDPRLPTAEWADMHNPWPRELRPYTLADIERMRDQLARSPYL